MRVAYMKDYIKETNNVHTNGYYIFVDSDTYVMPDQETGYKLFEQLLVSGYIDLRKYDRR